MTATMFPNRIVERVAPRPLDPATPVARVRPDPIANYALRRTAAALIGVVLVVTMAMAASAIVGAIGGLGGRPVAASEITSVADAAPIVRVHVAEPGDTLWSIADRYRGDVDRQRFVDALIDDNGGTVIQIGQAVRLP